LLLLVITFLTKPVIDLWRSYPRRPQPEMHSGALGTELVEVSTN
jgi:hypothetical protein